MTDRSGVRGPVGSWIVSSSRRPYQLWGPDSFLSIGHWRLSPVLKWPGSVTGHHLQPVPRSRKCGSILSLPHTPSWHSVSYGQGQLYPFLHNMHDNCSCCVHGIVLALDRSNFTHFYIMCMITGKAVHAVYIWGTELNIDMSRSYVRWSRWQRYQATTTNPYEFLE
jgi:hypothetical protein